MSGEVIWINCPDEDGIWYAGKIFWIVEDKEKMLDSNKEEKPLEKHNTVKAVKLFWKAVFWK